MHVLVYFAVRLLALALEGRETNGSIYFVRRLCQPTFSFWIAAIPDVYVIAMQLCFVVKLCNLVPGMNFNQFTTFFSVLIRICLDFSFIAMHK